MVRTITIVTAILCGFAGIALSPHAARTASQQWGDEILYLTDGTKIVAVLNEKTRSFMAVAAKDKSALKAGTYKLTNGGAIVIGEDGVIVWDAFGAVEKLKREGLTSGPTGLG